MSDLIGLRALLFVLAVTAVYLYGWAIGYGWQKHGHGLKLALTGGFVLLVYLSVIQIKAYQRDAPFDAYSWTGLIGVVLFDIGLIVVTRGRTEHGRR